jgi:hypothetical protein
MEAKRQPEPWADTDEDAAAEADPFKIRQIEATATALEASWVESDRAHNVALVNLSLACLEADLAETMQHLKSEEAALARLKEAADRQTKLVAQISARVQTLQDGKQQIRGVRSERLNEWKAACQALNEAETRVTNRKDAWHAQTARRRQSFRSIAHPYGTKTSSSHPQHTKSGTDDADLEFIGATDDIPSFDPSTVINVRLCIKSGSIRSFFQYRVGGFAGR